MNFILEDRHAYAAATCLNRLYEQAPGWPYKAQSLVKAGDWCKLCIDSDLFYFIGVTLVKVAPHRVYKFIFSRYSFNDEQVKNPSKNKHLYFSSWFRFDDDNNIYWTESKVRVYFTCVELLKDVLKRWDKANGILYYSIKNHKGIKNFTPRLEDGSDLIYDECGTQIKLETVDESSQTYRFGIKTEHQSYYHMSCLFGIEWRDTDDN